MSGATVQEWIQEAEEDYKSGLDLARRRKEPVPKRVCWFCQQSAEKYLKAFLVRHSLAFPYRHDLVELKNLCAKVDGDFQMISDDVAELNTYGPGFRYPGPSATTDDAKNALVSAKRLRRFVRAKLGLGT